MTKVKLLFPTELLKPDRRRWMWIAIFSAPFLLGVAALWTTLSYLAPSLPSLAQLEQIDPKLITKVYDKDSVLLHEFYVEKRIWTPIDSIPLQVQQAVIATEDRKFHSHWGLNVWAIPSAVLESVRSGNRLRGASTLTQQLAKLLFLTPERKITRKIKEAMTAIRIEQTYTKEEILEFYLNQVYLGGGNYGFQAASQFYFGKPLDSIQVHEVAVLAGMLQRPEAYRPDRKPEAALARRNTVLYAMRDAGYLDKDAYKIAVESPLVVAEKQDNGLIGQYFVEEIRKHLERKYGENALYADGISVYSTLDVVAQQMAEKAVAKQLDVVRKKLKQRAIWKLGLGNRYKKSADSALHQFDSLYARFTREVLSKDTNRIDSLRKFPDSTRYHKAQIAIILIENNSGAIRAMVGGDNYLTTKFNRAIQSLRQPGSAFKPFVYASAMDNGASPCDSVNDQPITIPDPMDTTKFWRPANYDKNFEGNMTLRRALYLSKNLPAIQVGMQYGLNNVVNYARRFGLKAPLKAVPSLAIGSIGATLMEMTSAYSVFPNGGYRIEPYTIESIVGKSGEIIEKNLKVEHEVLKKPSAYLMVDMLRDVNVRGTAAKVWGQGFIHPSGGKTGTTNDYTDAWYIGFTRQYTMGVWVGLDVHVPMGPGHTGGDDALPVWIEVMKELHAELPKEPFPIPAGVVSRQVCNFTGKVAGEFCHATSYCLYSAGNANDENCDGKHFENKPKASDAVLFSTKGQAKPSVEEKGKEKTRKTF